MRCGRVVTTLGPRWGLCPQFVPTHWPLGDSNPDAFRHKILNLACLPISPSGLPETKAIRAYAEILSCSYWSDQSKMKRPLASSSREQAFSEVPVDFVIGDHPAEAVAVRRDNRPDAAIPTPFADCECVPIEDLCCLCSGIPSLHFASDTRGPNERIGKAIYPHRTYRYFLLSGRKPSRR